MPPRALVTGALSGVGELLALARDGYALAALRVRQTLTPAGFGNRGGGRYACWFWRSG